MTNTTQTEQDLKKRSNLSTRLFCSTLGTLLVGVMAYSASQLFNDAPRDDNLRDEIMSLAVTSGGDYLTLSVDENGKTRYENISSIKRDLPDYSRPFVSGGIFSREAHIASNSTFRAAKGGIPLFELELNRYTPSTSHSNISQTPGVIPVGEQ